MTKLFLIAASIAASAASVPVVARDAAATTAPVEQSTASRADQTTQRYCVIDTITGSRIPYKKCRTRREWLNEGFGPLNPNK